MAAILRDEEFQKAVLGILVETCVKGSAEDCYIAAIELSKNDRKKAKEIAQKGCELKNKKACLLGARITKEDYMEKKSKSDDNFEKCKEDYQKIYNSK